MLTIDEHIRNQNKIIDELKQGALDDKKQIEFLENCNTLVSAHSQKLRAVLKIQHKTLTDIFAEIGEN